MGAIISLLKMPRSFTPFDDRVELQ